MADAWVPAFEGQRPPFVSGNEVSIQHGAYSPRKVDPLARDLVEQVLDDSSQSFLHTPAFRPALWAWARAEAQAQLLTEYLATRAEAAGDGVGDLDDERVRAAYLLLHRAEQRAQTGRTRLGMDPLSRARLGRDVAAGQVQADLAQVMAKLRDQEGSDG